MTQPCAWTITQPPLCCDCWDVITPEQQQAAVDYATTIMWASTGRVFGVCDVTVRPCGHKRTGTDLYTFYGFEQGWAGWIPYNFGGQWYNGCLCSGPCSCDPSCQVRLMGPVASVTSVTVGGVVVPDTAYRVDNESWLVRTDGECWPECPDMDTDSGDNVFVVAYQRGVAVPAAVLQAAGTIACEWAKACAGQECRLSGRVQSLARNGITIDMADPQALMESGFTGIPEVDSIIRAYNPSRLTHKLRVYAPELRVPRTVTTP